MEWLRICHRLSGRSLAEFAEMVEIPLSTLHDVLSKDVPKKEDWERTRCLARKAAGLTEEQFIKLQDQEYLSKAERESYTAPPPKKLGRPAKKTASKK